ncbi:PepSY domain-containing protein [Actinomadura sediminis]|uniref:PepSY domain-containing protein n=1 Tax=Actinomadura sediminis TaxID=1038904 RepID=A0ABW3EWW0_9ACTN
MGIDARRVLTGRRLLVTALAAAAVAGGGAATAVAAAPDDRDEGVPQGTRVTAMQAAQAALKAAPGTVEDIDLDDDGGAAVWEVDVVASGGVRGVSIDAGSGKVVQNRADRDDDDDDRREAAAEAKALGGAKVTAAAAANAALKAAPGTVTSVDFQPGDGPSWEVEVAGSDGTEREVTVDAASGKVLQNQADDQDDGAGDDEGDDD